MKGKRLWATYIKILEVVLPVSTIDGCSIRYRHDDDDNDSDDDKKRVSYKYNKDGIWYVDK